MTQRCNNSSNPVYERYGGRGITVCDRWLGEHGFENFLADMGERPHRLTLDRIDNNKGYSPENCRWATYREQASNTRKTTMLTLDGETMCLNAWARKMGIRANTLHRWLKRHSLHECFYVMLPAYPKRKTIYTNHVGRVP